MSEKMTVRFFCQICNTTVSMKLSAELQKKLLKEADKWPYPVIYHHKNHYSVIYFDNSFHERGVIISKFLLEEKDCQ